MTAFLLATLVATPAFAEKKRPTISPRTAAQAYAPSNQNHQRVDSLTVIVNGRIVGCDPDPNVRLMLRRDTFADAT